MKSLNIHIANNFVWSYLITCLQSDSTVKNKLLEYFSVDIDENKINKQIENIKKKISNRNNEKLRLIKLYSKSNIDESELDNLINEIETDKGNLNNEIEKLDF